MKACVVGGGTAGWITLSYLAATTDLDLTIIHTDEIEIIGVGESTTPALKQVADAVGVDESKWMKDGHATFKYGIDFQDWLRPGSNWFHSFDDQLPAEAFHQPLSNNGYKTYSGGLTSIEYFLKLREQDPDNYDINHFNYNHGPQQWLTEQQLSPYDNNGHMNIGHQPGYAYHINALEFGRSLKDATPNNKYTELKQRIVDVSLDDNGIKSLRLEDGTEFSADIYFDCSGFNRLLSKHLTTFKQYTEMANDSVIFGPVKNYQIHKPATEAVAQKAGWIWATPTIGQVGSGHVYSSAFMSENDAEETIVNFWHNRGVKYEPLRKLKFTPGRLENIAIKNVISNGLGQSFIEPLEATSIMITCVTAIEFSKLFNKHQNWNHTSSKVLDKLLSGILEHTRDFVRYHYDLNERKQDYWNQLRRTEAAEEVSNMIDQRVKANGKLLNGFNWASMLIGYEKKYTNTTADLTQEQIELYSLYSSHLKKHYRLLTANNQTIQQKLNSIIQ
jgi:tryptophan halogenase